MESWFAIYTKSKHELKVVERLERSGISAYCPAEVTMRQWSDRKKKVIRPLISSYVFIQLSNYEQQRDEVLNDPSISRFVFWQGRPAVIRNVEISAMKAMLGEFETVNVRTLNLQKGDAVRIETGPLANEEGVLLDVSGKKVIVQLKTIGMQLQAKLDGAAVRKLINKTTV